MLCRDVRLVLDLSQKTALIEAYVCSKKSFHVESSSGFRQKQHTVCWPKQAIKLLYCKTKPCFLVLYRHPGHRFNSSVPLGLYFCFVISKTSVFQQDRHVFFCFEKDIFPFNSSMRLLGVHTKLINEY